jgi:hypothetical protein
VLKQLLGAGNQKSGGIQIADVSEVQWKACPNVKKIKNKTRIKDRDCKSCDCAVSSWVKKITVPSKQKWKTQFLDESCWRRLM